MNNSTATIWTSSRGIMKQDYIATLLSGELRKIPNNNRNSVDKNDVVIGWGNKTNTLKAIEFAQQNKLPYLKTENGFIGYIGHPASNGHAVSLITDDVGIYYDAQQPSQLEQRITAATEESLLLRAQKLLKQMTTLGITKYNCYADQALPKHLQQGFNESCKLNQSSILIIDQVAGDLSLAGAMATETDFIAMVETAKKNHPGSRLLLRTHPDTRLGKKKGVLAKLDLPGIEIISDACHPHALIKQATAVYTVSSQMGFEALLLNKPVYCFGMPFYAGWGLTTDTKTCSRRGTASLEQLVAGALISYPKYFDPILSQPCEVEEVVDLIALQYRKSPLLDKLYVVGFSLWKRAFLKEFCRDLALTIKFVSKVPKQLNDNENILVWGAKYPEIDNCIRVEDGFIRSNGLGSNLCRPSSLSLDHHGIYFNSRSPSDLELLFMNYSLTDNEISRGQRLISILKATGVSKYNTGIKASYNPPKTENEILLVVGQVDGDASILTGSAQIKSNEALLWAIREAKPEAYIIYKPHPDVVSGNRGGGITTECLTQCVNEQVHNLELNRLFPHIDELHTMTSLSGFEALVQGVKVVTWGQPFYAGWGLTKDMNPLARRNKALSLSALVYLTLVRYPKYLDWNTGLWSTPEKLIAKLAQQNNADIASTMIWQRWAVKIKALWQTLLH